ncbi:hypothetical protein [Streptomyces triculaminicus]|uniref:hypothetical protein n=1 Tax=Streptomyces triculaminicus TaxID=2816232 RepID=UPI0037D0A4DB
MERTKAMRARLAAQMALPVVGAMGLAVSQAPAAAAAPVAAPRAAICSTYGAGSLLTGITHGAGFLVRGILGDYRNPKAANTHAVGKLGTSVSRITDGTLGRPETYCAPVVPVGPPPPPPPSFSVVPDGGDEAGAG